MTNIKMATKLLTTLILGHLLADFPLQTNTIATFKAKSFTTLLIHIAIHIFVTWGLLGFRWDSFALVCAVGGAHLVVDWLKSRLLQMGAVREFIIDQFAHLVCIFIIAMTAHLWLPNLPCVFMPSMLLYPSLILGFAFGGMVFCWLWASSHSIESFSHTLLCRYKGNQLLEWEQRVGFVLVGLISIFIYFNGR